jgi:hypothetical protein
MERLRVQSGLSRSDFEKVIRDCVAKYRRSQTEGGIMKPEELAREIVSQHMTVGDLEWLIREHMTGDARRDKLLAAVDPTYPEVREALTEANVGAEIEDLHLREVNAYAGAAFALGFAAAMQLRG